MAAMIVRHTVADFDNWKPVYDEHQAVRGEYGVSEIGLYRDATAANEVVIVFGVEDLNRAREFGASANLRETMERAGVISEPTIWFLNDA